MSESLYKHGLIDRIVDRKDLRDILAGILALHCKTDLYTHLTMKENVMPLKELTNLYNRYRKTMGNSKKCEKREQAADKDYLDKLFRGVFEVRGDRCFGDDESIVTAIAWLKTGPVTIIGQQKGHTLEERMKCNFGMPNPEGYRNP